VRLSLHCVCLAHTCRCAALRTIATLGKSLTGLDIGFNLSRLRDSVDVLLDSLGLQLHSLALDRVQAVTTATLDSLPRRCPNLRSLRLSVDQLKDRRDLMHTLSVGACASVGSGLEGHV
jgi:hypothetical protein